MLAYAGKSSPSSSCRVLSPHDQNISLICRRGQGQAGQEAKSDGSDRSRQPAVCRRKIYLCSTTRGIVFRPTEKGYRSCKNWPPAGRRSVGVVSCRTGGLSGDQRSTLLLGNKDQKPPQRRSGATTEPLSSTTRTGPIASHIAECCSSRRRSSSSTPLFNSRGQFLRRKQQRRSRSIPGGIDKSGLYKADNNREHTATILDGTGRQIKDKRIRSCRHCRGNLRSKHAACRQSQES